MRNRCQPGHPSRNGQEDGIRACLLVPDRRLQGACDIAEMNGILDQIDIEISVNLQRLRKATPGA
jgi:hypothetical protein